MITRRDVASAPVESPLTPSAVPAAEIADATVVGTFDRAPGVAAPGHGRQTRPATTLIVNAIVAMLNT